MSITIAKSVNFGAIKGSLSTVGYTLKNADGTTKQTRTTSGITELVSGKGIYGGNITFDLGFSGFIIWDSGDVSAYYAVEQFDSRSYQGSGGGVALVSGPAQRPDTWTTLEKKRVLKYLKYLIKALDQNGIKVDGIAESIGNEFAALKGNELKDLVERKVDFTQITQALENLKEGVANIKPEVDLSEINQSVEDIAEVLEGIINLIESEQVNNIKKEILL